MDELTAAIYRGSVEDVSAAVRSGIDVNRMDRDGFTPLMEAVLAGTPRTEIVALLLDLGADPRAKEEGQGTTVLHFAARERLTEIVALLLERNVEVDALDCFGNTPLWRATMGKRPATGVVELLVAHGADPGKANHSGVSPRSLGCSKPELRNLLGCAGSAS